MTWKLEEQLEALYRSFDEQIGSIKSDLYTLRKDNAMAFMSQNRKLEESFKLLRSAIVILKGSKVPVVIELSDRIESFLSDNS